MKKHHILISIILIFVLTGCATMSGREFNALLWYFRPQSRAKKSEIAFIGVGKAANERQALLLAYSDINNRLFAYMGTDASAESYRELTKSGRIESYDFQVIEKYQVSEDNQFIVYLLGLGKKQTLERFRSDEVVRESEIALQVENLILEGDELIKSNQDILGLKKYIQSMVLSYPLTLIEDEYSFASIMNEVLNIINSISMSFIKNDSSDASCMLSVKRKSSLIPSRVINAPVKASYKAMDARNIYYDDSFVFSSSEDGTIVFTPKNTAIAKTGSVVFKYDLEKELRELAKVSEISAGVIAAAVEDKALVFDYSVKYGSMKIALSSFEFSVDGYYSNSNLINTYLTTRFKEDDVDSFVLIAQSDDDDEKQLNAIHTISPDCDLALICRVGYSDYAESRTGTVSVTSEGFIRLYDLRVGELVFDSDVIFSNGFGDSEEKALENSYSNFAAIIYSIVKAFYV